MLVFWLLHISSPYGFVVRFYIVYLDYIEPQAVKLRKCIGKVNLYMVISKAKKESHTIGEKRKHTQEKRQGQRKWKS